MCASFDEFDPTPPPLWCRERCAALPSPPAKPNLALSKALPQTIPLCPLFALCAACVCVRAFAACVCLCARGVGVSARVRVRASVRAQRAFFPVCSARASLSLFPPLLLCHAARAVRAAAHGRVLLLGSRACAVVPPPPPPQCCTANVLPQPPKRVGPFGRRAIIGKRAHVEFFAPSSS